MERALVTGASGFIGKRLVSELSRQEVDVLAIPHSDIRSKPWEVPGNLDYIFHLASYGNMASHSDRAEIVRANILDTFNLLEATKDIPYTKFVYVSSSSVGLPVQTLYSASKLATEQLIKSYDKPIAIVRPHSITGVGEQPEHLIPTLIRAAYGGGEIPFVPFAVHDFFEVGAFAKVLVDIAHDGKGKKTYDIGSGRGYSNDAVKKLVEETTGRQIKTNIVDSLRSYDTKTWICSQRWPCQPLGQTIEDMVEAYAT